jgi:hypothetical protein
MHAERLAVLIGDWIRHCKVHISDRAWYSLLRQSTVDTQRLADVMLLLEPVSMPLAMITMRGRT